MLVFTGVSYSHAQGTNLTSGWSAQEQVWTLLLIFPVPGSRGEDWFLHDSPCMSHCTTPLCAGCVVHHRSGHQTAPAISSNTGLEVAVFSETQQSPHITAEAAAGPQPISEWFGANKVREKKQHLDKSMFKVGRLPHLQVRHAGKQNGTEGMKFQIFG